MSDLLIIDDDAGLFSLLRSYLKDEGFAAVHAADSAAGLALLAEKQWDAVILDVMLPGQSGFEVLRIMRSRPVMQDFPVLMLTARGEEMDRVSGLDMGADDYLTKPFSTLELVARLRALIRRFGKAGATVRATSETFVLDDITIDAPAMSMTLNGVRSQISMQELRLLELFFQYPGEVVKRGVLYQRIFNHPPFAGDRSLDMLVSRLRKKLGPAASGGERIRAARGEGYVFLIPGEGK